MICGGVNLYSVDKATIDTLLLSKIPSSLTLFYIPPSSFPSSLLFSIYSLTNKKNNSQEKCLLLDSLLSSLLFYTLSLYLQLRKGILSLSAGQHALAMEVSSPKQGKQTAKFQGGCDCTTDCCNADQGTTCESGICTTPCVGDGGKLF